MAVYTDVSTEDLEAFLAAYPVGELQSAKGIAEGVENSNYLISTEKDRFILTLYEKRVEERDLPFFLGLMEHLAARDFRCPVAVRNDQGAAHSRLKGRAAALITFLTGVSIEKPKADHCRQVGQVLAQFHQLSEGFAIKRPNALGKSAWRPFLEAVKEPVGQAFPAALPGLFAELEVLDKAWTDDLPRGIIHADLFPDNVFFLRQDLSGVIDFYFACNETLLFDLAVSLNAWCFDGANRFDPALSRAMLAGYQSLRPLTAAEKEALPIYCRGTALRFVLTRLHDWVHPVEGALVQPKKPQQFLERLAFHQDQETPAVYGL